MTMIQTLERPRLSRVALIGAAAGAAILAAVLVLRPHTPDLSLIVEASPAVRIHLGAALFALLVALFLLSGTKGTWVHRAVGWIWSAAMMTTALSSFVIMELNHGQLSFIHVLSGWTAFATPMGIWQARKHNVRLHRRTMTGLVVGGLIVAGLFTLVPGRLMWRVFFG